MDSTSGSGDIRQIRRNPAITASLSDPPERPLRSYRRSSVPIHPPIAPVTAELTVPNASSVTGTSPIR